MAKNLALVCALSLAGLIAPQAAYGAVVTPAASPGAAAAAKPVYSRADGADVYTDTPPALSADSNVPMPGVTETLRGSSSSLITQLLRTVVALVGVLALLIVSAKIIAPRLVRGIGRLGRQKNKDDLGLHVTDRIVLDGRNTLVQVQLAHGTRYLLACSDHGTTLVDRIDGPGDAPAAQAKRFADHLGTSPTSKE